MPRDYDIAKTDCICHRCNKHLEAGAELVATVREVQDDLQRDDFCPDCWSALSDEQKQGVLGVWRSRVPAPQDKKKLFVDDELLINLFERLESADTPAKVNFRFVLALVLMRKKLLVYDRTDRADPAQEVWQMHLRGSDAAVRVVNPHLDDDKIAEVSGQLGQIMEGQL